MIIEAIAATVLEFVGAILTAIPEPGVDIPDLGGFVAGYTIINAALPLDAMIASTGITLTIVGASFPWFVADFLYLRLPGKAT